MGLKWVTLNTDIKKGIKIMKKDNLLNLNREELIEELKKEYRPSYSPYYNDDSADKLLTTDDGAPMNESGFKFYDYTKFNHYYYFVSDIGRVALVKIEKLEDYKKIEDFELKKNDIESKKYEMWIIPRDSYTLCLDCEKFISDNSDFANCRFNSSTPIYTMVGRAWLKNEYNKAEELACDKEQIDLHHINGNNNDCSIQNLIYLPKSIHSEIHSKNQE